jgi:transcriptional regulator with XRE-family HTH domain
MQMNTIGDTIRKARASKNISQQQLADILGINRVSISNYEKNKNKPTYNNVVKIANVLNIPEQFLFNNINKQKQNIIRDELKNPSKETQKLIKEYLNDTSTIVNNNINGNIIGDNNKGHSITHKNTDSFQKVEYENDLKELDELLKYAPANFLENTISKLKNIKKIMEES